MEDPGLPVLRPSRALGKGLCSPPLVQELSFAASAPCGVCHVLAGGVTLLGARPRRCVAGSSHGRGKAVVARDRVAVGGGGEHCQNLARACLPCCRWHRGCTGRVTSLAAVPGTHGLPTLTTAARWGGLGAGAREPAKELPCGWATPRRLWPLAQPRCGGAGRAALAWASRWSWQRERRQAALCAGAIDSGSQRKWDQ